MASGREKLRSEPQGRVALLVSEKMMGKTAEPQLKNSLSIGSKPVLLHSRDLEDLGGWLSIRGGRMGLGEMGECSF